MLHCRARSGQSEPARPLTVRIVMRITVAAGAIAGAAAAVLLLAVHALLIVPIWWSAGGAWKAMVAGAVIGGAWHVILRRPPRLRDGVWIGLFLWGALQIGRASCRERV